MGAPIENGLRAEIIERHTNGETLRAISSGLGLPYETVKGLWQHWQRYGQVEPRYEQAKNGQGRSGKAVYEAAVAYKRAHPGWGGGLIRLKLVEQGYGAVPSIRTLQGWFRAAGVGKVSLVRQPGQGYVRRRQQVHEVWAVDAKEQMQLADGSWASGLVVSDEASGAVLQAEISPPALLEPSRNPSRPEALTKGF